MLSFSSSELRVWRQVSGSWSSRLLSNEMLLGSAEWATAGVISTDGMCPGGPTGAGGEISCWCGGSVDASGRLVAARFREEGGANGFVIWSTTNCRPLYVVRGLREELWDLRMGATSACFAACIKKLQLTQMLFNAISSSTRYWSSNQLFGEW
eukprot:COSAG05_NODE_982_length_6301_cov_14.971300_3_plen_153_part_00